MFLTSFEVNGSMSAKQVAQHTLGVSDMIMEKYLTDLEPDAFLVRPIAGMNHLAWQIGHLISVERKLVEEIKPGSSPALPPEFDVKHAMDQHDIDDPARFHQKEEYLSLWKAQRAATHKVLDALSDEEIEAPPPSEKSRQMCPTVGAMFNLAGLHSLMHAGQFVAVRRQQAMPIVF